MAPPGHLQGAAVISGAACPCQDAGRVGRPSGPAAAQTLVITSIEPERLWTFELHRRVKEGRDRGVILRAGGASHPSPETRSMLEDLQREAAMLAQLFAEADKLFTGWLRTIQTKRAGYTGRGQAAPLQLVGRMSLEG